MTYNEFKRKVDRLIERAEETDDGCEIDDSGVYHCYRGSCHISYDPKNEKYSITGEITIGSYGVKDLESEFEKMYHDFGEFW